jgi:hypothetical protein
MPMWTGVWGSYLIAVIKTCPARCWPLDAGRLRQQVRGGVRRGGPGSTSNPGSPSPTFFNTSHHLLHFVP